MGLLVGLLVVAVALGDLGWTGLSLVAFVAALVPVPGLLFWRRMQCELLFVGENGLTLGDLDVPWSEVLEVSTHPLRRGSTERVVVFALPGRYLSVRTYGPAEALADAARARLQRDSEGPIVLDALQPVEVLCTHSVWAAPNEPWLPPYRDAAADTAGGVALAGFALFILMSIWASGYVLTTLAMLVTLGSIGARWWWTRDLRADGLLIRAERGGLQVGDERIPWEDVASLEVTALDHTPDQLTAIVLQSGRALLVRPPGSPVRLQQRLEPFLAQPSGRTTDVPRELGSLRVEKA